MKKTILFLMFIFICASFGFSTQKTIVTDFKQTNLSGAFNFGDVEYFKSNKTANKKAFYGKIMPHKQKFFWGAIGTSIGAGVILTTAIIFSGVSGYYGASITLLSLGHATIFYGLAGSFWGLFWFVLAPIAAALWVLYALCIHAKKKGYAINIVPTNDTFGFAIKL
ncbi:MAG: hypothetical protein A2Z98_09540 [Spirochaetes bacterium GWB1_27_13]|nr:MAG: hypothetical protein A2Z98_09540 [Spirochaetes bacterium GWB1_27_13]